MVCGGCGAKYRSPLRAPRQRLLVPMKRTSTSTPPKVSTSKAVTPQKPTSAAAMSVIANLINSVPK